jgi:hypothetical protein
VEMYIHEFDDGVWEARCRCGWICRLPCLFGEQEIEVQCTNCLSVGRFTITLELQMRRRRHGLGQIIEVQTAPPCPVDDAEAIERSRKLLKSLISPAEREELDQHETITVKGVRGHRFQIRSDTQTVIWLDDGPIARACLQLTIAAPVYDRMIAEYLLLKNDESLYLQTANTSPPIDLWQRQFRMGDTRRRGRWLNPAHWF